MAGYDIFTPYPQAPVDINLYPQAANAGINAGNALPSTTTALIQGGIKGIQTGLDIYSGFQQIELNKAKIQGAQAQAAIAQNAASPESIERANQLAQTRVDTAQAQNDITDINLKYVKTNEQTIADTKLEQLKATREQAQYQADTFKQANDYKTLTRSKDTTADELVNAAFGTDFNDLFSQRPGARAQLLGSILQRQDIDPATRQRVGTELQIESLSAAHANNIKKNGPAYKQLVDTAETTNDGLRALNLSKFKLTKEDVPSLVMNHAKQWKVGTDSFYQTDEVGNKVPNPRYVPSSTDPLTEYAYIDPKTGRERLIATVNEADKKDIQKLQEAQLALSGSVYQQKIQELRNPTNAGPQGGRAGAAQPSTGQTQRPPATFEEAVQTQLRLSPQTTQYLKRPLAELQGYVNDYLAKPELRTQDVFSRMPIAHFDTLVNGIAVDRFKSPVVRSAYTAARVTAYNDSLQPWILPLPGSVADSFLNWANPERTLAPVKTPFELYLREQRRVIINDLRGITSAWYARQTAKAQAVRNRSDLGDTLLGEIGE